VPPSTSCSTRRTRSPACCSVAPPSGRKRAAPPSRDHRACRRAWPGSPGACRRIDGRLRRGAPVLRPPLAEHRRDRDPVGPSAGFDLVPIDGPSQRERGALSVRGPPGGRTDGATTSDHLLDPGSRGGWWSPGPDSSSAGSLVPALAALAIADKAPPGPHNSARLQDRSDTASSGRSPNPAAAQSVESLRFAGRCTSRFPGPPFPARGYHAPMRSQKTPACEGSRSDGTCLR
jgi:hypothetical protein